MLSSSYCQPALHGPLNTWSRHSTNQPVPVKACCRASQRPVGVSEGIDLLTTKDAWRAKKKEYHILKRSEAAESPSVVWPSLSLRNGLSLANVVDDTTTTAEKESVKSIPTKKPGNDIRRPKLTSGTKTGDSGSRQALNWMAPKSNNPGSHQADDFVATNSTNSESHRAHYGMPPKSINSGSHLLTENPRLSSSSPKPSRNRKDVWRPRPTEETPSLMKPHVPFANPHKSRRRLYLVDIHPLCYDGNKVQPSQILHWMHLLFSEVTQDDPIVAVMDGERGNEFRRALLPTYKAKRPVFNPLITSKTSSHRDFRQALPLIHSFLTLCQIPVVKHEFAEADDTIATLAAQAISRDFQVVIASPDMDFQQLLAPQVHMLLPLPELRRWSFYTLDQYVSQNGITPDLELGVKCMVGDFSDNVPGLPQGFGRKTAVKLMRRHGSLEELLGAASARTVGKKYVQEALTKHEGLLRRNWQVLKLRTDVEVELQEEWGSRRRWMGNDGLAMEVLKERLLGRRKG